MTVTPLRRTFPYSLPMPARYRSDDIEALSRARISLYLHWRGEKERYRDLRDDAKTATGDYVKRCNAGSAGFSWDASRTYADSVLNAFRAQKDAAITAYEVSRFRDGEENILAIHVEEVYRKHPLPEYEAGTLGTATFIGQAEGGTDEWHSLRQLGIGGSQILDAAGYEVDYKSHRLKRKSDNGRGYALEDLLHEKTLNAEERVDEGSDATQRGHLWEPVLLDAYAEFTGANVVIGKQTWRGPKPWQVVNVDGIILGADGKPEGLVECKNSNNDKKWEKGVPVEFRAQVLYYLDATGLEYADLVARVNGDVTVHRITRGEALDLHPSTQRGTLGITHIEDIHKELAQVWNAVKEVKEDVVAAWDSRNSTSPDRVYARSTSVLYLRDPATGATWDDTARAVTTRGTVTPHKLVVGLNDLATVIPNWLSSWTRLWTRVTTPRNPTRRSPGCARKRGRNGMPSSPTASRQDYDHRFRPTAA